MLGGADVRRPPRRATRVVLGGARRRRSRVAALVGLDAATGGSSHVTHAFRRGPVSLAGELAHRVHISAASRRPRAGTQAAVFAVSIVALVVLATRPPRFPAGDALLVGIAVSLLVNDSPGDVASAGALSYAVLWAYERVREPARDRRQGRYASASMRRASPLAREAVALGGRRGGVRGAARLGRPAGDRSRRARLPAGGVPRPRLHALEQLLVRGPLQLRHLQPPLLPARGGARDPAARGRDRRDRDARLRRRSSGGSGARRRAGRAGRSRSSGPASSSRPRSRSRSARRSRCSRSGRSRRGGRGASPRSPR